MKYLAIFTVFLTTLHVLTANEAENNYGREALNKRQLDSQACNDIFNKIPEECLQFADEIDLYFNESTPCSETCGEPLYNYFTECFEDGPAFDLQCAINGAGERCADILNSYDIFGCNFSSIPDSCTATCAEELKQNNIESDCCLYSILVVLNFNLQNATYVDEFLRDCNVRHASSCIGAFSGEPIVPNTELPSVATGVSTTRGVTASNATEVPTTRCVTASNATDSNGASAAELSTLATAAAGVFILMTVGMMCS